MRQIIGILFRRIANSLVCKGCGENNYRSSCPFAQKECYNCGRMGHTARVCYIPKCNNLNQPQTFPKPQINIIDLLPYFKVQLAFNREVVSFIVDTGAPISLINLKEARRCKLVWGPIDPLNCRWAGGNRCAAMAENE